ncbi:hypothetical protein [Amycolatopsis minnesotensis]|uniref:Uncharacterized protein n=1 Tax=Amycolatopsis minnesotensis TaxID=337894 RepID=A0ABN2SAS9_9PSEU
MTTTAQDSTVDITEQDRLAEAVDSMVWWLQCAVEPIDPDLVVSDRYRYFTDDELELGKRVADDLLDEFVCTGAVGVRIMLERRLATRPVTAPAVDAVVDEPAADPLPVGPGRTVWSIPAYAPYVLPGPVLDEVLAWMDANGVVDDDVDVSATHEVRVDEHDGGLRTIAYHRGKQPRRYETPDLTLTPARVLLRTEPPVLPSIPDLTDLGEVIEQHPVTTAHFNTPLPIGSQICTTCTAAAGPSEPVVYPCPALVAAAAAAGAEVYPDDDQLDAVERAA